MRHRIFAIAVAGALGVLTVAAPAQASDVAATVETAAEALTPNAYVWHDPGSAEPVTVVVSIPQQRAFVYRGTALVAASSVSTGKDGKETPVGVYPILQKNQNHKSNLYDSAPMPFMQRLTWDGIALHAGRNPGFPASHGCVRMPTEFAKRLFQVTDLGTTVVVTEAMIEGRTLDPALLITDDMRANQEQLASLP